MSDITSRDLSPIQHSVASLKNKLLETVDRFIAPSPRKTTIVDAVEIVRTLQPEHPVLSFSKSELARRARIFREEFPGQVTYAVKANDAAPVLKVLTNCGIDAFDVASLAEIEGKRALQPNAELHYHNPAKSVHEIETAYHTHGVRHFALDHEAEFKKLLELTAPAETTLAVRFKLDGAQSVHDFTTKFGLDCDGAAKLLRKIAEAGFTPSLTFHPGSQCYKPNAYSRHIQAAASIAREAGVELACLNVGGGFPTEYPGRGLPPLQAYFDAIRVSVLEEFGRNAPLISCEPGRAMVATCMSLLVKVKLVRHDLGDVFLNDGKYGGFLEPTLVPIMPAFRLIRDGKIITSDHTIKLTAYGPTCDPIDTLPVPLDVPSCVRDGDYLEFSFMGAYSAATATGFNGYGKLETISVDHVFAG